MDFWLLNAMVFNAAYHTFRTPAPKPYGVNA
jgi:hypothetical protein